MSVSQTGTQATLAPLLATSATAHNGLEKLSIRLAELQRDGVKLPGASCDSILEHLNASKAAALNCAELIAKMRREPIEIPAPIEEKEEDSTAQTTSKTPEDEIFPVSGVLDHLTGLPGRVIAHKALESALSVGRPRYAGICSIDRLRFMSTRYGIEAGQEAIRCYAAHLRQKMPSDTMLFRWTGASVLALYDLSGPITDARGLLEQISSQKVKFNYESHQRSALLSLSSSTLVVGLATVEDVSTVVTDLDSFIAVHSRKQPD